MKIKIEDTKILSLLSEKNGLNEANTETLAKMEKLEKEFNTNLSKMKRLDEKVRPLIIKLLKDVKLGEFDELSRVAKDEKTKDWELEVVNRLDEFKVLFKQRKK